MLMGLTPKVLALVPVALISGLYQKPYLKTKVKFWSDWHEYTFSTMQPQGPQLTVLTPPHDYLPESSLHSLPKRQLVSASKKISQCNQSTCLEPIFKPLPGLYSGDSLTARP
jgi:hypothetical protein